MVEHAKQLYAGSAKLETLAAVEALLGAPVTLPTVREQPDPLEQARSDHQGVIRLTQRLVRIPSRAGIDLPSPSSASWKLGCAGMGSSPSAG